MMFRRLDALSQTLKGDMVHMRPFLTPLVKTMREAHRVVFAEAAGKACYDLAEDEDALERARPQIFAPHETTWLELNPFMAALWISEPGDMQRGGLVVFLWDEDEPRPWPLLYFFDADIRDRLRPAFVVNEQSRQQAEQSAESQPIALYMLDQLRTIAPQCVMAAFALLASKGMTHSKRADLTKLNRARARQGKYPLLGYEDVKLNIDAERIVRDKRDSVVATGNMPQHQVRAHLRLLRSGKVVIVRAHSRGNPELGMKRTHYSVVRDADLGRGT